MSHMVFFFTYSITTSKLPYYLIFDTHSCHGACVYTICLRSRYIFWMNILMMMLWESESLNGTKRWYKRSSSKKELFLHLLLGVGVLLWNCVVNENCVNFLVSEIHSIHNSLRKFGGVKAQLRKVEDIHTKKPIKRNLVLIPFHSMAFLGGDDGEYVSRLGGWDFQLFITSGAPGKCGVVLWMESLRGCGYIKWWVRFWLAWECVWVFKYKNRSMG